jgi:hypothetical protein
MVSAPIASANETNKSHRIAPASLPLRRALRWPLQSSRHPAVCPGTRVRNCNCPLATRSIYAVSSRSSAGPRSREASKWSRRRGAEQVSASVRTSVPKAQDSPSQETCEPLETSADSTRSMAICRRPFCVGRTQRLEWWAIIASPKVPKGNVGTALKVPTTGEHCDHREAAPAEEHDPQAQAAVAMCPGQVPQSAAAMPITPFNAMAVPPTFADTCRQIHPSCWAGRPIATTESSSRLSKLAVIRSRSS